MKNTLIRVNSTAEHPRPSYVRTVSRDGGFSITYDKAKARTFTPDTAALAMSALKPTRMTFTTMLASWACTFLGTAIIAALLSVAGPAMGQGLPAVVGVHAVSGHKHTGHEDVNPGLYARWPSGFTAGAFRNSERRASTYAGWTFTGQGDYLALTVGIATGYSLAPVVPIIMPSVRVPLGERASARLSFVPAKNNPALHLSLEWRL